MARPYYSSLMASLLAFSATAPAEDTQKIDAEFLEFLGSDDLDDEDWSAMLAAADKASKAEKAGEPDGKKAEPADKKTQPAEPKKGDS